MTLLVSVRAIVSEVDSDVICGWPSLSNGAFHCVATFMGLAARFLVEGCVCARLVPSVANDTLGVFAF